MADLKQQRLDWLARLFSHDAAAIDEQEADRQLFDRYNDAGMAQFLDSFRPLTKLREQRGPIAFSLGEINHLADDLTLADLTSDGETLFQLRVRFEADVPHRIRYWSAYPPLPDGITIRPYTPDDAAGCVALERASPIESSDGTLLTIDRGASFDDYLRLMGALDAMVVVNEQDDIVGFYANSLRPMRFHQEDNYAVYQHHYRVHPAYRKGSVSMALAASVDSRRTFDGLPIVLPYSLMDPNNPRTQHMGFPAVPDVRLVRLSIPVSCGRDHGTVSTVPSEHACRLINETHRNRVCFRPYTVNSLEERCSRISSYQPNNLRGSDNAVIGVWESGERNIVTGTVDAQFRLAFILDYGFVDIDELISVIKAMCAELAARDVTHLCILCDSRAPEYGALESIADKAQGLSFHTLPWLLEDFAKAVIYADGAYC